MAKTMDPYVLNGVKRNSELEACIDWEAPNYLMMNQLPIFINGHLHGNDRYRYPSDHPLRLGTFRRALIRAGLWSPPAGNQTSPVVDLAEDLVNATGISFVGALGISLFSGGAVSHPEFGASNFTPRWASQILWKVRCYRLFGTALAGLGTYYVAYNFLTGYMKWPVTKYGEFHCAASCAALVPACALRMLAPLPVNRAMSGVKSRFGRFYTTWGTGCCVAGLYNWQLSYGIDEANLSSVRRKYYVEMKNAPGFEIVSKLPHIPFYKESEVLPYTAVRNPYHDAQYVREAKAKAQKILANYSL